MRLKTFFYLYCSFCLLKANLIALSLSKILEIPSQSASYVSLKYTPDQINQQLYKIRITYKINQISQQQQAKSMFDFIDTDNDSSVKSCYQKNVERLKIQYKNHQPCKQYIYFGIVANSLRITKFEKQIADGENTGYQSQYLIDNTFYPCLNGAFMPDITLFQSLDIIVETNDKQILIQRVICVVLLQILFFLVAYFMIMRNKLHSKRTKLSLYRQQVQAQKLLDSYIQQKP